MIRITAAIIFILFVNQANAQTCPDFYRFVDFGLKGNDGVIYRGGPTFRAESFSGELILLEKQTKCLKVPEVSKDGHGNPIPVVTSINYDPAKTGIDLNQLRLSIVDDTENAANENASIHQARLAKPNSIASTQGSNFLCASTKDTNQLSCQLVSPYAGNVSLVVYCDALECRMPVLAINKEIQISAVWESSEGFINTPENTGLVISNKVQKIKDFLTPLSASF